MAKKSRIKDTVRFLKSDIWKIPLDEVTPVRAFFLRQLQIMIVAVRGMYDDKLYLQASALTFYTLLSLVPVIAMAFGIATGFGLEKYLEAELERAFAGREEILEAVLGFARSLLEATRGGLMAGIGLIILFYTVMRVLSYIEDSFNDIWRVKQPRSVARKFTDYFSMMLIGPIFIILSNLFTVFFTTQIDKITENITLLGYISPLIMFFVQLIPFLLIWFVFTILYMVMPNTRVNFSSALVAGIIAGTLFQFVQWGYIHFQVGVSRYNAIYGSFAALPLLLMWMQVSWLVVLFGAEISFANQNVEQYEYDSEIRNMSIYNRRLVTFYIVHLIIRNFENGVPPFTARQISHELKIPFRLVREILYELIDIQVVSAVRSEADRETTYQPAIDINKISVKYLADKLDHRGMDVLVTRQGKEIVKFKGIMEAFNKAIEKCPENKLLKDI
jgi:membrane protein